MTQRLGFFLDSGGDLGIHIFLIQKLIGFAIRIANKKITHTHTQSLELLLW